MAARLLLGVIVGAMTSMGPAAAGTADSTLPVLDTFFARGDKLEVTLEAKTTEIMIGGYRVETDVFRACQKTPKRQHCSAQLYAGPRFVLNQGDTLRLHYRNELKDFHEMGYCSKDAKKPDKDFEVAQPVNNHTHGLVVRANGLPGQPDDRLVGDPAAETIGDNIFESAIPPAGHPVSPCPSSASGSMAGHTMPGMSTSSKLEYEIRIPGQASPSAAKAYRHPSGIAWFHPHFHGLAKEQVSAGLAGMINIGSIWDYACIDPRHCAGKGAAAARPPLRHMLLKDIQLEDLNDQAQTATVLRDQDAGFCDGNTETQPSGAANEGFCVQTDKDGRTTGKWVFSINGRMHPKWSVQAGGAEIWRIQNASANVTYDLQLVTPGWDGRGGMPFQVIAVDGVGVSVARAAASGNGSSKFAAPKTLQRRLMMMPGSRAEILVAYRDPAHCDVRDASKCRAAVPTSPTAVKLVNLSYDAGNDKWPRIELGVVTFEARPNATAPVSLVSLRAPQQQPESRMVAFTTGLEQGTAYTKGDISKLCAAKSVYKLAAGEKRRIYFGIVKDPDKPGMGMDANWRPETFLMGSSIIKSDGSEWEEADGTLTRLQPDGEGPAMRPFEHMDMDNRLSDLCVAYDPAPGSSETWELVNVSDEIHNFHIHQNKFTIVDIAPKGPDGKDEQIRRVHDEKDVVPGTQPGFSTLQTVEHDTALVPRGLSTCGDDIGGHYGTRHDVKQDGSDRITDYYYRIAAHSPCRGNIDDDSGMLQIRIPFNKQETIGRYVFHCHILEHEDLGMMSSIRVLSPAQMEGAAPVTAIR